MSRSTALRRLRELEGAGCIKAEGERGAKRFILIRRPDV
jgi:DNA-binding Lrp family transcriptional regulator